MSDHLCVDKFVEHHFQQMSETRPLKRHHALRPLSRDHHHGLLLCWKIRTGIKLGVEPMRIKDYADHLFQSHIQPHFVAEEQWLFPILGHDHELVKKALAEHRRLTRLFSESENVDISLSLIEEELESHIRFEERELFNTIQEVASPEQLAIVEGNLHNEKFEDSWPDEFWVR